MQIKPTDQIAAKWARVTPQRTTDYSLGVQNPRRPWQQSASAAAETYKAAVTDAANKGLYARGINAAGEQKWQSRTLTKGPGRFAEGVQVAEPDFAAGFAPFAAVLQALTLPPRFVKGDPRNLQRVSVIAAALNKKRTGSA